MERPEVWRQGKPQLRQSGPAKATPFACMQSTENTHNLAEVTCWRAVVWVGGDKEMMPLIRSFTEEQKTCWAIEVHTVMVFPIKSCDFVAFSCP